MLQCQTAWVQMSVPSSAVYVTSGYLFNSNGSVVKNLSANAGDMDSIPGWGRSPGEGNGFPFHLVLKGLVGLHRTTQLQLLQCYWLGHRLGLP